MGPERAAKIFKQENPDADRYECHALRLAVARPASATARTACSSEVLSRHADGDHLLRQEPGRSQAPEHHGLLPRSRTARRRPACAWNPSAAAISSSRASEAQGAEETYPENSFAEIAQYCKWRYISLREYVELNEGAEIWVVSGGDLEHHAAPRSKRDWRPTGVLPGGLNVQRKAKYLYDRQHSQEIPQVRELQLVCAYAFAAAEQNADNGTIVTAPTCGSCGVLPAVLMYLQGKYHYSDLRMAHALGVAGIIGNLIRRNASISGAECGCQAEIGSACSMAAAAMCELMEFPIEQIEYAAEIAMEHHLGLTCDPICGLVQIPCIERNAVAAKRAIDVCKSGAHAGRYKNDLL